MVRDDATCVDAFGASLRQAFARPGVDVSHLPRAMVAASEGAGWPMSFRGRLRTVFMCAVLEIGVLMGVPVRVEQVEELLRAFNQPRIAETEAQQAKHGGGDAPDA
jgi:hypothetical protein